MFATQVGAALTALRAAVTALQPGDVDEHEAARLVELFVEVERLGAAGRTLAARRVADSSLWSREGHRSPASWLAAVSGTPVGNAITALETAQRLDELPKTDEALRSGRLSEVQVREIASAAAADPTTEESLLRTAEVRTVAGLRAECRKVRAAADPDAAATYRRIHRERYFRHWTETDGAVRIDGRFTPDAGAALIATVNMEQERIFRRARKAGRHEPNQAYAADALVAVVGGYGQAGPVERSAPRAMVHVLVDHSVLTRGDVQAGDTCEIPGVGPIPAETARALATDSILRVLVTDGADIKAVSSATRSIPSRLRAALQARDRTCVVPGCDETRNLQHDHWRVPFAAGGPTDIDTMCRVCPFHHYLKTYCGHQLDGGPGRWRWRSPDELEGTVGERSPPPAA